MEIKKTAVAGTVESNDIMITISPGDGINIDLQSPVKKQFGSQMEKVIRQTLSKLEVLNADIRAIDKGALDFTIEARVACAVERASGENINWEMLL